MFKSRWRESASFKEKEEELNDYQKIIKATNINKVLLIGILSLCGLIYSNVESQKEDNRSIVIWPNGTVSWVSGVDADISYVRMMTGYLLAMWGNVSSGNADIQLGEILNFVHPLYHSEVRKKIISRANTLKKYKTVTLYTQTNFSDVNKILKKKLSDHNFDKIDTPVYKVTISIHSSLLYNNKPDKRPDSKDFSYYYTIDNGRAYILDIEERINEG